MQINVQKNVKKVSFLPKVEKFKKNRFLFAHIIFFV